MFQESLKYKIDFFAKAIIGIAMMGSFGILLPNNVGATPTEPERPGCEDYQNKGDCISDQSCFWVDHFNYCMFIDMDQGSFFQSLKNQKFEFPENPLFPIPEAE